MGEEESWEAAGVLRQTSEEKSRRRRGLLMRSSSRGCRIAGNWAAIGSCGETEEHGTLAWRRKKNDESPKSGDWQPLSSAGSGSEGQQWQWIPSAEEVGEEAGLSKVLGLIERKEGEIRGGAAPARRFGDAEPVGFVLLGGRRSSSEGPLRQSIEVESTRRNGGGVASRIRG